MLFAIIGEVGAMYGDPLDAVSDGNAGLCEYLRDSRRALTEEFAKLLDATKEADLQNAATLAAVDEQTKVFRAAMEEQRKVFREQEAAILAAKQEQRKVIRRQLEATDEERVLAKVTDYSEGFCMWKIPNFSSMQVDSWGGKYSDVFSIFGHKWQLCLYPRGYGSAEDKFVSLHLDLAENTLSRNRSRMTLDFSLSVICQHDPEKSHKKNSIHEFKSESTYCGHPNLIPLTDFYDAANGYLVNDTVTFQVELKVKSAGGSIDPKKMEFFASTLPNISLGDLIPTL